MKKLLIATKNPGKINEISKFLKDLDIEIVSLKDLGIKEDIEEDEKTYEDNSRKKALFFSQKSGLPTIADDGGLEIDALNGEPGIHSRRWLGYEASDEELIEHMKKVSKNLPQNNLGARFVDVVSFAFPDGRVWANGGELRGIIKYNSKLKVLKGYPYRSFFYIPEIRKYYHENELTPEEERVYNHRYKAISKLKTIIKRELGL